MFKYGYNTLIHNLCAVIAALQIPVVPIGCACYQTDIFAREHGDDSMLHYIKLGIFNVSFTLCDVLIRSRQQRQQRKMVLMARVQIKRLVLWCEMLL